MSPPSTLQGITDYQSVRRLLFYEKGAMSFQAREIEPEVLEKILKASTSCAWLGKWKLVSVSKKGNIVRVVESWQRGLRKIGQNRDVEFVERWKKRLS